MGYRYGARKFGEGLYSRWPDAWLDKRCLQDDWAPQTCDVSVWSQVSPERPTWDPIAVTRKPIERRVFAVGTRNGR